MGGRGPKMWTPPLNVLKNAQKVPPRHEQVLISRKYPPKGKESSPPSQ